MTAPLVTISCADCGDGVELLAAPDYSGRLGVMRPVDEDGIEIDPEGVLCDSCDHADRLAATAEWNG